MRFRNSPHRPHLAAVLGAASVVAALTLVSAGTVSAVGPTIPAKGATPTPTTARKAPSATTKSTSGKSTSKTTISKSASKARTPSVKGDFTMFASPSKRTIAAGEETTTQVTLKKTGGFASIVNITASGVPSGVKISFPPRIQFFAPVTMKVPASVDDGTYKITFRGTSGKISRTATFTLVVDGVLEGAEEGDAGDELPEVGPSSSGPSTVPGASTLPGASTVPGASTTAPSTTIGANTTSTTVAGVVRSLNPTTTVFGATTVAGTTVAAGDYSVAVSPVRVILPVGGAQSFPITASINGAPLTTATYTLAGLPTGVTSSLGTASSLGATTVTLSAPAGTAAGTSVITVAASSNGIAKSATFELIVTTDMAVAITPQTLVATAGGSASASVTVGTVTSFTSLSTLSLSGLPAGVTGSFATPTFTSGTTTLTLAVGSTVAVGNYPFTLTATAGSTIRSSLATLSVNATTGSTGGTGTATNTGTAAELSLSLNPAAQSVAVNGTIRYTATVSGTAVGTAGAVIAVGGLPQNASVSVVSNPTTNTSTITITVAAPVALGTSTIVVTATAGSLFRTATTQLTITA